MKQCYPFNKILSDCLRVLIPLTSLLGNRFQYKLSDRSRKELGLLNQLQQVVSLFGVVHQYTSNKANIGKANGKQHTDINQ